jgi:hypothetical protein
MADLKPVHLWHHNVEKYEVWHLAEGAGESLLAIICEDKIITAGLEQSPEDLAIGLVVVSNENQGWLAHIYTRPLLAIPDRYTRKSTAAPNAP